MLRYLRGLADKDLALDRSMIPLGSCTMKLNATSEMIPVTWPEFATSIRSRRPSSAPATPAAPQLESWLCEATGYAGVRLQPNAGSQGEYAGLLAIRAYHEARGDAAASLPDPRVGARHQSGERADGRHAGGRDPCDADGNVDLADLEAKCERTRAPGRGDGHLSLDLRRVRKTVEELCAIVHRHGGQVYIDGANMNALVGVAAPGEFGGDVSHLNLHKTFCIPHGGGGPGVGPVCVVADLVPSCPAMRQRPARAQGSARSRRRRSATPRSCRSLDVHAHDGRRGLHRATEPRSSTPTTSPPASSDHYELHYSGNVAASRAAASPTSASSTCGR